MNTIIANFGIWNCFSETGPGDDPLVQHSSVVVYLLSIFLRCSWTADPHKHVRSKKSFLKTFF